MKKMRFIYAIIIMMLIPLISVSADPLKIEEFSSYSIKELIIPESVNLKGVTYEIGMMTDAELIPVAWSGDGKFAYIIDTYPDGFGDLVRRVVVQDLKSDKVLYQKQLRGPEMDEAGISRKELPAEFRQALGVYEMSPDRNIMLYRFPMMTENYAYSAHIEQVTIVPDGHFYGDILSNYRIRMRRSDGKSKVIHNYSSGEAAVYDVQTAGCFISPYENRTAVIIGEIKHGFEASKLVSPKIAGSHLRYGFE